MLGRVIFLAVSLSTLFFVNGTPLHDTDLDVILDMLQKKSEKGQSTSSSSSSSTESDDGHSFMDHLKNIDVIDLIQQANKENNRVSQNDKKRFRYRASPNLVNQRYESYQYEPYNNDRSNRLKDHIFKLIQEGKEPLKKVERPRMIPNRLLSSVKLKNDEEQEQVDGLQKYSKIFVVLDPVALKNSKNNADLPSLISRILAQSSSAIEKTRQERNNKYLYKGFAVKDHRRFRRDSKEMYGGGGGGGGGGMDLEDDYRPKRPRNDHGGGGGGGGRTAIPYIRHRGDIYERDH